jgi:exo-beta-1,3-glucanase (GH17 family)
MPLLKINGNTIRTYGCIKLEVIADHSLTAGITLAQGIWLDNIASDQSEKDCAITLAKTHSNIGLLIAGNERVLFNRMSVDEVCDAVLSLKQRTNVPITTAEPWQIWRDNPKLVSCVDIIFIHIHPYWECQPIDQAAAYVAARYNEIKQRYPGKRLIIGETGWPSQGATPPNCDVAVPSQGNQARFAEEFVRWANANSVEYFFFEAFDEPWKCGANESGVECHWGIYDTRRVAKPAAPTFHHTVWLPVIFQGYDSQLIEVSGKLNVGDVCLFCCSTALLSTTDGLFELTPPGFQFRAYNGRYVRVVGKVSNPCEISSRQMIAVAAIEEVEPIPR